MAKPNIVFMYGEDSFSIQREIKRWKSAFIAKHGEHNFEVQDFDENDFEQIKCSILSAPFLGEKRLVILKSSFEKATGDEANQLIELMENTPDSTVCLIVEPSSPDKRSKWFKYLEKNATCHPFGPKNHDELAHWIEQELKIHNRQISPRAKQELINYHSRDLWQLNQALETLSLQQSNEAISVEQIQSQLTPSIEQSIFTLTDHLGQNNHEAAIKTLQQLHESGEDPFYLFAMIVRQFRLILEMKQLSDSGMGPGGIAQVMKVHPFVVKKTLPSCRHFTYHRLKSALKGLLELDTRVKTGKIQFQKNKEDQYLLAIERILIK